MKSNKIRIVQKIFAYPLIIAILLIGELYMYKSQPVPRYKQKEQSSIMSLPQDLNKDIKVATREGATSRGAIKREKKIEYTLYELNINNETFLYFEDLNKAEIQKDYLLRNTERLTVSIKEIIEYNKDKLSSEYTINNTVENYISKYKKKVKCFPTISHKVTSTYGKRPSRGDFHCGVDLAGKYGDSIYAYKSGKVIKVQHSNVSYGNMVLMQHNDGSQSRYAHMSSINVKNGQYVNCGDKIGAMGSTGNSTGVHLHFEIIINGKTVNPYGYIF